MPSNSSLYLPFPPGLKIHLPSLSVWSHWGPQCQPTFAEWRTWCALLAARLSEADLVCARQLWLPMYCVFTGFPTFREEPTAWTPFPRALVYPQLVQPANNTVQRGCHLLQRLHTETCLLWPYRCAASSWPCRAFVLVLFVIVIPCSLLYFLCRNSS